MTKTHLQHDKERALNGQTQILAERLAAAERERDEAEGQRNLLYSDIEEALAALQEDCGSLGIAPIARGTDILQHGLDRLATGPCQVGNEQGYADLADSGGLPETQELHPEIAALRAQLAEALAPEPRPEDEHDGE